MKRMRRISLKAAVLAAALLSVVSSTFGQALSEIHARRRHAHRYRVGQEPRNHQDTTATIHPRKACAILMTKNEWPTLRSWVLHHGDLLGFENVHVIDNSDDARAADYLHRAIANYGISRPPW